MSNIKYGIHVFRRIKQEFPANDAMYVVLWGGTWMNFPHLLGGGDPSSYRSNLKAMREDPAWIEVWTDAY